MNPPDQGELVRRQFGATAEAYVSSPTHAAGDDLDTLVSWAEGGSEKTLLDVATGGGHTALAMTSQYGRVVASDLTETMLEAARRFVESRGATNVTFEVADAQSLTFPDDCLDAVCCRIAPHHFPRVDQFVAEAARVLKPGGIFLLEDSVVPEVAGLGEMLNAAEHLRDPSHVRSLTGREWLDIITGAGLGLEEKTRHRKRHDLGEWLDRARTPESKRDEIDRLFREGGDAAIEAFRVELSPTGRVVAFADEKILVKARKPGSA
jgi:SAM-dependent methyltransferase